jgi:hypothetical protein
MTHWCFNCETEAVTAFRIYEDHLTYMCATCAEAFRLGQECFEALEEEIDKDDDSEEEELISTPCGSMTESELAEHCETCEICRHEFVEN